MSAGRPLPAWADAVLVPLLAVVAAFGAGGLVVAAIGVDPWNALRELVQGSLGSAEGLGFTLYYATDFIFTGLAVALAFQGGLFNIGAEGQAYVGGLGAALVCLHGGALPPIVLVPAAVLAAALFGAAWAAVPGVLQARRGSHIVITTIMFNFLASTLMAYLLANVLRPTGDMQLESAAFPAADAKAATSILPSRPMSKMPARSDHRPARHAKMSGTDSLRLDDRISAATATASPIRATPRPARRRAPAGSSRPPRRGAALLRRGGRGRGGTALRARPRRTPRAPAPPRSCRG